MVMHRDKKQNQRLLNLAYLKYKPLDQMMMTSTETFCHMISRQME